MNVDYHLDTALPLLRRTPAVLRALLADLPDAWTTAVEGPGLAPPDLARRGLHPALGTVTLGELLATWVAHDLDHLGQITRVMARQYEDAVGPWRQFLSVLRRS